MYAYLNGEFLREAEARVSVFDRGFLYGDGVFETMRAYSGYIFRLNAHLRRLFGGLEALRIKNSWTEGALMGIVYQLLKLNNLKNAYIRLTISRGVGGRGIGITGCDSPTIAVFTREFKPYPVSFYRDGVRACISDNRRSCRGPLDSSIKSLSFLNNILVRIEASERGAFEAIMLNPDGYLTEGAVSNLFFVSKGILYTPSVAAGILRGITRQTVLEMAGREGFAVREGLFREEELYQAEEVFLTNSMMEIMPVSEVEGKRFEVSGIVKRLMDVYREMVADETLQPHPNPPISPLGKGGIEGGSRGREP